MDDKKRDLIPVAAIALFLVIIIALCAVRLHQRRETRAEIAEKARRYGTARNRQSLQNQRRRTQRIRRKKRQERKSRRRKGDSRRMRR